MNIYVCGGSSEMDAVADDMAKLREMGHVITHDWVAVIRIAGESNPRNATHQQRVRWSEKDLIGIENASLVWVRLPVKTSFGCAFEAGFAIGKGMTVIMSGNWLASIFSSQVYRRFNDHAHAIDWIRLYGTPGSWDDEMAELEAI